ncbi:hypothetical protein ACFO4N_00160 [Camelliibacillus cellulosilyticus]|uniref:Uncharacterized protein n=1 Tax=Camelliibacillus cellulosilyticus TaxID=2174486 RepID=A0ABV9GJ17_9BACL
MIEKDDKKWRTEIEHPHAPEIEHHTPHPDPDSARNLNDISFAPGENHDLNEHTNNC